MRAGWGELHCATALLPERYAPTPASRVPRAAGPPREGEVCSDSRGDENYPETE